MTTTEGEDLYARVLVQKPRLVRQLGVEDAGDAVHDIYLAAAGAIGAGRPIRCLDAYVGGITRVRIVQLLRSRRTARALLPLHPEIRDRGPNQEEALIERERLREASLALRRLPRVSRELVTRFYCRRQPKEIIARELRLSPTQFRLLKSRALARAHILYRSRWLRAA